MWTNGYKTNIFLTKDTLWSYKTRTTRRMVSLKSQNLRVQRILPTFGARTFNIHSNEDLMLKKGSQVSLAPCTIKLKNGRKVVVPAALLQKATPSCSFPWRVAIKRNISNKMGSPPQRNHSLHLQENGKKFIFVSRKWWNKILHFSWRILATSHS